jgi:hypothetical protein
MYSGKIAVPPGGGGLENNNNNNNNNNKMYYIFCKLKNWPSKRNEFIEEEEV